MLPKESRSICTTALLPKFEIKDFLYLVATIGCSRAAAMLLLLNLLHF